MGFRFVKSQLAFALGSSSAELTTYLGGQDVQSVHKMHLLVRNFGPLALVLDGRPTLLLTRNRQEVDVSSAF